MNNKNTVIIILAVAIILVGLIVVVGASTPYERQADARYNYDIAYTDTITSTSGYEYKAEAGKTFAVLSYRIVNDYATSISTNTLSWQFEIKANGLLYPMDVVDTFVHRSYQLVDIPKGGNAISVQVFQIPKNATVEDVVLKYVGWETVKLDTSIVVW